MTKKYKLLLSGSALAATAAIVPLSIVACGSTATDMTQDDANKAAVISDKATASTDTKKYYTPAAGDTTVTNSEEAKTKLAALGITLTLTSQSGKNDFVISSYTIKAKTTTSVDVTLTGKSGETELTTTAVEVKGFTATTDMNQAQASAYATVSANAVSGKITPVVADVTITNANAVAELAKLGITLTLGTTPEELTPFTISSYSIAAKTATSVDVTIKGTSGATEITTTAVTVSGFTLPNATQTDFNAYATVAPAALTDKTYNTPAATNSAVAITKDNAVDTLKSLGINLTLGTQPANKNPIDITSYTITVGDNNTSVSVVINGTSGTAISTTAVTVTGFTAADSDQIDFNAYAKVAPAALSGKTTPSVATDVTITNDNAIDTLKALGINLTLGTQKANKKPIVITSYSIAAGDNNTSVNVTIKGTSGSTNLTTTIVTVVGFELPNATQTDFDAYASVSHSALTDKTYNTPAAGTTKATSDDIVSKLKALGINLTLGTQKANKKPIVITSYSIAAGDNNTSVNVTIDGVSGKIISTTAIKVTGFTAA